MKLTKENYKLRREKIKLLIKKGISLNKISSKLQIAKSTLYHHYKKIKGKKTKAVVIPKDDAILGEFLGAFAGDGNFFYDKKYGHYTISFHFHATDDKKYADYIKSLTEINFRKKVRSYTNNQNKLSLVFYSKDIYKIIFDNLGVKGKKGVNLKIIKPIKSLSKDFKISFIRGLIDTDGHVNKYGQIILSLIAMGLVKQVSSMLLDLGIQNKLSIRKKQDPWQDQLELKILKKDALKYNKFIGFSNKRKQKNLNIYDKLD